MQRAVVVALGIAIASSAAGVGINAASQSDLPLMRQCAGSTEEVCRLRIGAMARADARARVEQRYESERARCATLPFAQRDACFIAAHAARGRTLLEAAAPYARPS
jgi:hypothetical protein